MVARCNKNKMELKKDRVKIRKDFYNDFLVEGVVKFLEQVLGEIDKPGLYGVIEPQEQQNLSLDIYSETPGELGPLHALCVLVLRETELFGFTRLRPDGPKVRVVVDDKATAKDLILANI